MYGEGGGAGDDAVGGGSSFHGVDYHGKDCGDEIASHRDGKAMKLVTSRRH